MLEKDITAQEKEIIDLQQKLKELDWVLDDLQQLLNSLTFCVA